MYVDDQGRAHFENANSPKSTTYYDRMVRKEAAITELKAQLADRDERIAHLEALNKHCLSFAKETHDNYVRVFGLLKESWSRER